MGTTTISAPALFVKAGGQVGIGTTAPAAKLDVSGTVKASSFQTEYATTGNINSGVATTILTTEYGRYEVWAFMPDAGMGNYGAFATVISDNTDARIVSNNGALLTITLSGKNVQVTQNSGGAANVYYNYLRIW